MVQNRGKEKRMARSNLNVCTCTQLHVCVGEPFVSSWECVQWVYRVGALCPDSLHNSQLYSL